MFSDVTGQAPIVAIDDEVLEEVGPLVVFDEPEPEEEPEDEAPVVAIDDEPEAPVVQASEPPTAPPLSSERVEKSYSSAEVVEFFNKSKQWLYWGMRTKDAAGNTVTPVFVYRDGTPIEPIFIGKGKRRRYTLPIIREMALSCYRRGNLKEPELRKVLAKITAAERDEIVTK